MRQSNRQSSWERAGNREVKEFEKKANAAVESGLTRVIRGIPKLRKLKNLVPFLIMCGCTALLIIYREPLFEVFGRLSMPEWAKYIVWILFLLMPLYDLAALSHTDDRKQEPYIASFEDIGFKGKDGNYPYLLSVKEQDKKTIYRFKSNISLQEWKSAQSKIETALNCSIIEIVNDGSKKIVKITAVSSDLRIPKEIEWKQSYLQAPGIITVGEDAISAITFDINKTPHILIGGDTGSGKSVLLRSCLWQMISQGSQIFMFDFKGGVEFGKKYEQFGEVVMDRERAVEILTVLCEENRRRLDLFREAEVKNLREYNNKTGSNLCRIGVFCDEIAEMMDTKGCSKNEKAIYEKIEGLFSTLARLSRATGINMFMGVQRPDANVLPGQIKNNMSVRICGRTPDRQLSEIVIGNTKACDLSADIGGRCIIKIGSDCREFQAYYFDDDRMMCDIDIDPGDMLIEDTGETDYPDMDISEKTAKTSTRTVDNLNKDFDYDEM